MAGHDDAAADSRPNPNLTSAFIKPTSPEANDIPSSLSRLTSAYFSSFPLSPPIYLMAIVDRWVLFI
jgi:hypothetical protein